MIVDSLLGSVAAATVTFGAAPVVLSAMRRANVIDEPNARSSHSIPTPRGGGLACLAGAGAGCIVLHFRGVEVGANVTVPALAIAAVGLADDQLSLSAALRLGSQIAIGAGAGAYSGLGSFGGPALGAVIFPIVVNAVNFMDGINGISCLTAGSWGFLALVDGSQTHPIVAAPSGAILLGASLGFLPWNAPEARIFLGDVGSYFIGGSIAATALAACRSSDRYSMEAIGLALSPLIPYFADTGFTLLRRAFRGRRLFDAHREHFYQGLVDRPGWSHSKVAGVYAMFALLSGGAARFIAGRSLAYDRPFVEGPVK